jgi:hypothetical protein
MTRRQRQARYAAEHRHWRDRLLRRFETASADALEGGGLWYPRAEAVIAELADRHGVARPRVAAIIAVLSPRQRWRKNVESAVRVLEGEAWRAAGYAANRTKAERLAAGAPLADVIGGDKVTAFWANLIGSREAVTVDTWAARAAYGLDRPLPDQPKGTRYTRLARAYRAAAESAGIPPREFQAIVWLAVRPASEFEKDELSIGGICE